jgi:2-iminobutanoate/2-iminopropanoate deaminase
MVAEFWYQRTSPESLGCRLGYHALMKTAWCALFAFLSIALVLSGSDRKVIHPKEFRSGLPFSPGILIDGTLYVSGQVGNHPETGKLPADFEAEVRQTLDNAGLVLKEAGLSFDDVVSVQVYLTDMELFQHMNAVYVGYFKKIRPTRTTVGVAKLVGPCRIEITITAKAPMAAASR